MIKNQRSLRISFSKVLNLFLSQNLLYNNSFISAISTPSKSLKTNSFIKNIRIMILKPKTILILAPHTDDGELGCGGTINSFIKQGVQVHYLAFSACEESVPNGFDRNILRKEVLSSTSKLGIPKSNVKVLNYQVRNFLSRRQEILDDMISVRQKVNPDLIFTTSLKDIHQDHKCIAEESVRAFKKRSILSYELPWNNIEFKNTLYFALSDENVQSKINALKQYKSQGDRNYFNEDFIRGLCKMRGVQIGAQNAEVFEIIRMIL